MILNLSIYIGSFLFLASCGRPSQPIAAVKNEHSGTTFWYMDAADRRTIVEATFAELKANYAPLEVKEKRIGLDLETLRLDALLQEQKAGDVPDSDNFSQAAGNLAFLDRMQKNLAKFQDTHLAYAPNAKLPFVFNGLEVKEVSGKVYVVAISSSVMEFNADRLSIDDYKSIALGDEVIAIDGVAPQQLIGEMSAFINRSSPAISSVARGRSAYSAYLCITSQRVIELDLADT